MFATVELLWNGVRWGNNNDPKKEVVIYLLEHKHHLYVAVSDERRGFDLEKTLMEERWIRAKGSYGYGLRVTKSVVDELYSFGDNVVYFRKSIPSSRVR